MIPTREEIAEIVRQFNNVTGGDESETDLATADALLARLRPAFEELDTLRVWQRDAQQTLFDAGKIAGKLAKDRATLRASLARKDEALRACVESLEKAHACATLRPDGTCDGCFVSAALARAQEAGK